MRLKGLWMQGMAPAVGLEPTTNRLTVDRSTTELRGNVRVAAGCRPTELSYQSSFVRRNALGPFR